MSILSDDEILEYMQIGEIGVSHFVCETMLQPSSIDLTVAADFLIPNDRVTSVIDLTVNNNNFERVDASEDGFFVIAPHQFVLATTKETVRLGDQVSGLLSGRSSVGRQGLFVENAGWVDPGFEGQLTLELLNARENFISIPIGMRLVQIAFYRSSRPSRRHYGIKPDSKYMNQVGTTVSQSFKDVEYLEIEG